jgi:hypothetical protein
MEHGKPLHSLIPLTDFTAILGIDDRDEALSRYCLMTATFTIEQYCRRRLLNKKHYETLEFHGNYVFSLRDYPVREVLAVYAINNEQVTGSNGELIEPEFYRVIPDLEDETGEGPEDTVYSLVFSSALKRYRNLEAFKAVYRAGYSPGEVPADLASACLELAAWNMSRYRGQLAMSREQLAVSMPENVRLLLEPYRRRTI